MNIKALVGTAALAALMAHGGASAEDTFWGLELDGSFGEGGFTRYVPPLNNPTINETPYITTELRPFYAYHSIPGDFPSNGGSVQALAAQARIAITDRLGFIATTDGYTWIDFNEALPDDNGLNDLAFGLKYAVISAPEDGTIATVGLRYTAPVGTLETGGLDLNGFGSGWINPFVSGAQVLGPVEFQGSLGAQIAISEDNWSYIHGSLHANFEPMEGVGLYPLMEINFFAPIDGGDQIPGGPLASLTGADIVDLGADDPQAIVTVGGGLRYRLNDNVVFGAGADVNVLQSEDHVYGWRVIADAVIHF